MTGIAIFVMAAALLAVLSPTGRGTWGTMALLAVMSALALRGAWPAVGLLLLVAAAARLAPWFASRGVAVPLGKVRLAYGLARASFRARRDPVGVSMVAGAWAAARRATLSPEDLAWLEGRVETPLTGNMVLASGWIAAARGKKEEARELLRFAGHFDPRTLDDGLLASAHEWRAAEAAARGAWEEVRSAGGGLGPRTATTRWLVQVAGRLLGEPVPSEALARAWAEAGRPRGSTWLQERALAWSPPAPLPAASGDDEVLAWLQAHADALACPTVAAARRAAVAFERARPTLDLAERARALGDRSPDPTSELVRQAGRDLGEAFRRAGVPLPGEHPLWSEAQRSTRDDALRDLEAAGRALRDRLEARGLLTAPDELREWVALARQLEATRSDPTLFRMAFRPIYEPLTTLSVRLHNDAREVWLSNAITRWLLQMAELAGDERAVELQTRNLAVAESSN